LITQTFTNTALEALSDLAKENLLLPAPAQWREERVLAFWHKEIPSLQGILDWFARYQGDFAQLEEALQRPHSRLDSDPRRPGEAPLSQSFTFSAGNQIYRTRGPRRANLGVATFSFLEAAKVYATLCNVSGNGQR